MKWQMQEINKELKNLHRLFLDRERLEAEKLLQRKLSSFDFLFLLTQDQEFAWMRPFSTLIADIDAFLDEEEVQSLDLRDVRDQIVFVLQQDGSPINARIQNYLGYDGEFILAYSKLNSLLAALSAKADTELRMETANG
ncbi:hypothetical protein AZI85_08660 [Bdellovibrio bacteriovorus]|uniref:Uncharacterized protein n=1 Tax=Bdellovibrio bacteriovorus TaxID=959 RepID=A0A150WDS6_BDEBC|nr:hypothetical protein [Bdellovibrio bacteriovorus]KYG61022.1 hypothetical protein AZI85_08660 [Bdellovibrio bacteriovorus]